MSDSEDAMFISPPKRNPSGKVSIHFMFKIQITNWKNVVPSIKKIIILEFQICTLNHARVFIVPNLPR